MTNKEFWEMVGRMAQARKDEAERRDWIRFAAYREELRQERLRAERLRRDDGE